MHETQKDIAARPWLGTMGARHWGFAMLAGVVCFLFGAVG